MAGADVAQELGVSVSSGLSAAQVESRQSRHGPNALPSPPRRRRILLLVDQVRNPLILMLLAAAVIAGLVGDYKDTVVILTVIVINSLLGFVQEFRAEHSLESLREMLFPTCVVRRDGRLVEIEAVGLVPGDLVVLEAGSQVPADGRLLLAEQLQVDESALTGESLPTSKRTEPLPTADAAVGDRWCMAFMNTLVTRGRGELVVTTTGAQTELGVLADLIARTPEVPTPIQRQLAQLGRRLAAIGGVAVAAYLLLGLLRGDAWHIVLLSAVALAVAAVPEGLPVVVTVTLAVGVRRMARRGALVKHLASVETLGATSVVCTDKTGTLTVNQMTVRTVWVGGQRYDVSGTGYHDQGTVTVDGESLAGPPAGPVGRLARAAALCNDSRLDGDSVLGDPMEAALLVLATKVGVDPDGERIAVPRLGEIPFDARHRYMVTAHLDDQDPTRVVVMVKGALDVLLDRCTHLLGPQGTTTALDASGRAGVSEASDGWLQTACASWRWPIAGSLGTVSRPTHWRASSSTSPSSGSSDCWTRRDRASWSPSLRAMALGWTSR
ncbi:MAG: HAD-IC family P-type ATPase [Pedococcus sp.]